MTRRHPPRLALALLEWALPAAAPLAGDLLEDFERRPSALWFWIQVLHAIAACRLDRSYEIRPLRLVEFQPADAVERSRRMNLRFKPIHPAATPLSSAAGGLGLAFLVVNAAIAAPGLWWLLLASSLAGALMGATLIAIRERQSRAHQR